MARAISTDPGPIDRVPPQNLEAERSVIGAMMLERQACMKAFEIITEDDFYRPGHRIIFETIKEMFHEEDVPADLLTVTNRLREKGELEKIGGAGYLSGLLSVVPSVENVEHYAKILRDKSLLRSCIGVAHRLADWSYGEKMDPEEIIDKASGDFLELAQKREERDFARMEDLAQTTFEQMPTSLEDVKRRFLETTFKDFDNIYHGFYAGEYVILAARPSVGKTSLALNIATMLGELGKGIVIFSLEMPKEQLATRMISSLSGVPSTDITTKYVKSNKEFF
jgi:replicative DNA helicase